MVTAVCTLLALALAPVLTPLVSSRPFSAQDPPGSDEPLPSFEVVSIKPNHSGQPHGMFAFRPGRFTATCVPLRALMAYAYHVRGFQIYGGPSWVSSETFDIEAKEPEALGEEIRKLPPDERFKKNASLLQSMLVDRFKMRMTRETRELPIYALVVAKNGPKLEKAKPGVGIEWNTRELHIERGRITARGVELVTLARALSQELGRTVIDRTGLKGAYEVTLEWAPDPTQSLMGMGPGGGPPPDNAPPPPDPSGPSIFTAIQEQLGLKLESTKGPVEILVIDQIEKPSEN